MLTWLTSHCWLCQWIGSTYMVYIDCIETCFQLFWPWSHNMPQLCATAAEFLWRPTSLKPRDPELYKHSPGGATRISLAYRTAVRPRTARDCYTVVLYLNINCLNNWCHVYARCFVLMSCFSVLFNLTKHWPASPKSPLHRLYWRSPGGATENVDIETLEISTKLHLLSNINELSIGLNCY